MYWNTLVILLLCRWDTLFKYAKIPISIVSTITHYHVINWFFSFIQTRNKLYFVLDFCSGGMLLKSFHAMGMSFLPPRITKFIVALLCSVLFHQCRRVIFSFRKDGKVLGGIVSILLRRNGAGPWISSQYRYVCYVYYNGCLIQFLSLRMLDLCGLSVCLLPQALCTGTWSPKMCCLMPRVISRWRV